MYIHIYIRMHICIYTRAPTLHIYAGRHPLMIQWNVSNLVHMFLRAIECLLPKFMWIRSRRIVLIWSLWFHRFVSNVSCFINKQITEFEKNVQNHWYRIGKIDSCTCFVLLIVNSFTVCFIISSEAPCTNKQNGTQCVPRH